MARSNATPRTQNSKPPPCLSHWVRSPALRVGCFVAASLPTPVLYQLVGPYPQAQENPQDEKTDRYEIVETTNILSVFSKGLLLNQFCLQLRNRLLQAPERKCDDPDTNEDRYLDLC